VYAQSLLEELRSNMLRLDAWLLGVEPYVPPDLTLRGNIRASLASVLGRSYVALNADDIERVVVDLAAVLATQIHDLHERFELERALETDLFAVSLVINRQFP
jgi:hypothetical protein